jgi:hypothetical protein
MKRIRIPIISLLLTLMLAASLSANPGAFTDKDYVLASLDFTCSFEKAKSVLGALKLASTYQNEIARCPVKVYEAKGVRVDIAYYKDENGALSRLWAIEVSTPAYPTARGIKVGDELKKVQVQYGKPAYTDVVKTNGTVYTIWSYENMQLMKRLSFKSEKGKDLVTSITAGRIID